MTSWTVGFCYRPVFGLLAWIQGVVCRHGRLLAASPDLQHVVRIELRPLGLRRRRSALGGVDGVPIVVCVCVRRDHPQERACDSAAVQPVVSSPDPSCMLCWSKPDHPMMYPLLAKAWQASARTTSLHERACINIISSLAAAKGFPTRHWNEPATSLRCTLRHWTSPQCNIGSLRDRQNSPSTLLCRTLRAMQQRLHRYST